MRQIGSENQRWASEAACVGRIYFSSEAVYIGSMVDMIPGLKDQSLFRGRCHFDAVWMDSDGAELTHDLGEFIVAAL
jgi:hypothetical protein